MGFEGIAGRIGLNTRSEMVRFLRADRKSKSTGRIDCQRTNTAILSMYCTERWPVLLYSTLPKYGGELRPKSFELVVLHGAVYENNMRFVNEALGLLGFGAEMTFEPPQIVARLKRATQPKDEYTIIISQHMPEFDNLVPDHQFHKLARFIGARNRRFAWWMPKGAEQEVMLEVP